MKTKVHHPVLLTEVLEWLTIQPTGIYLDLTLGAGGHSSKILEQLEPPGKLIGLDQDLEILTIADSYLKPIGKPYSLHHSRFSDAPQILKQLKIKQVNGVLWDLGVSSLQLDQARRGFSFSQEGPLDMRMNPKSGEPTAADIVNTYAPQALTQLFSQYGEEPHSRKYAQLIAETRQRKPIRSTLELGTLIAQAAGHIGKIHPATRVFQALRIAVNHELEELEQSLANILSYLAPQARLVVISFHSLEDRIVKQFFKQHADVLETLTEKPVLPTDEEQHQNPRSRSAKLRCAAKK